MVNYCVLILTATSVVFADDNFLYLEEATTQGDPLTMPFLICFSHCPFDLEIESTYQIWNADDAAACGKISDLYTLWDGVSSLGPSFGYFPNAIGLLLRNSYVLLVENLFMILL